MFSKTQESIQAADRGEIKLIQINEDSPLFSTKDMHYKEFPSDFGQIRYFTLLVVQKAPVEIKELNLLEQQVSEIIKNAVKHGNNSNPEKTIKVWYHFTREEARIIVEDEGPGFQDIEKWNKFNKKRVDLILSNKMEELINYVSYRTPKSELNDGGNALFAAVEYWNGGYIFNKARNKVVACKKFPRGHARLD